MRKTKDTIVEYDIITQESVQSLRSSVTSMINCGWEPLGGVTVEVTNWGNNYHQSMILRHGNNT